MYILLFIVVFQGDGTAWSARYANRAGPGTRAAWGPGRVAPVGTGARGRRAPPA